MVVGPGSVQVWNLSVAMYSVSARETYFGRAKEAVFSRAPFFNPTITTEGKL